MWRVFAALSVISGATVYSVPINSQESVMFSKEALDNTDGGHQPNPDVDVDDYDEVTDQFFDEEEADAEEFNREYNRYLTEIALSMIKDETHRLALTAEIHEEFKGEHGQEEEDILHISKILAEGGASKVHMIVVITAYTHCFTIDQCIKML